MVTRRKVTSLFIATLAAGVTYHFPWSILALPVVGFVISFRLTDDECTYHELVSGMNRDLLFLYPIMVAVVGVALVMNDTRQLPTSGILFVLIYYYREYLSYLSAYFSISVMRLIFAAVVWVAVLALGLMSWVAVDYAASLLANPGWTASDQKGKTHIVSSISLYVLLAPISGMVGSQLSMFLTAIARRLVGK